MVDNAFSARNNADAYPGQRLGLPRDGAGSLAPWRIRITALVVDWAASMAVAVLFFGVGVLGSSGWRAWMIMAVFFVESAALSALFSGSIGQLATRIAVVRLDREPLGLVRSLLRAAMVCLVIPALVVGVDRRGLHDVAANTVVVKRR